MLNPDLDFNGESYHIPYTPALVSELPEDYLPDNVTVHIDFGLHECARNFQPTAELFKRCDIYIPEAAGHPDGAQELANILSKSNAATRNRLLMLVGRADPSTFEGAEFDAMTGSYKSIAIIDGSEHETTELQEDDALRDAVIKNGFKDTDQTLEYLYENAFNVATDEDTRDGIMIEKLGPVVGRMVIDNNRLRKASQVAVLMRLGPKHYSVFERLSESTAMKDRVTARTVEYRNLGHISVRLEEQIKSLIIRNERVPKELIVAQYLANASNVLIPQENDDPFVLESQAKIRERLTAIMIASGGRETVELIERIFKKQRRAGDMDRLIDYVNMAKQPGSNVRMVSRDVLPRRGRSIRSLITRSRV